MVWWNAKIDYMLTCKEVSKLLSQSQDANPGFRARLNMKLHLMLCDGCTNFQKQLVFIRVALRRYRDRDQEH